MQTEESKHNPSITITISVPEAMTIIQALQNLERTHRKHPKKPGCKDDGKWGHYDCPPKIKPIDFVIKGSIEENHPEIFSGLFGYDPSTNSRYSTSKIKYGSLKFIPGRFEQN